MDTATFAMFGCWFLLYSHHLYAILPSPLNLPTPFQRCYPISTRLQVLGLTATLRPRFEVCTANACGLPSWDQVVRASCARPAVQSDCVVYADEAAALHALIQFKPQLLCVKTKAEITALMSSSVIKKAYICVLPHYRDLDDANKERAYDALHNDSGTTLVIATSGITTGTNPKSLFRVALWKGVWSIDNAVQASGRCARTRGQKGVAKLITWHQAVADDAGSEFAELAQNPSTFFQNSIARLDSDKLKLFDLRPPQVQPALNCSRIQLAIDVLDKPGTWALPKIPYMQCHVCGCPHMAKHCTFRLKDDVPRDFCVACLLPLWKVDGSRYVHDPTRYGHSNCENVHKQTTRQLFLRAR
jgi:hypothetical protein